MSHTETITTRDRIVLNEEVAREEEEDRIIVGIMADAVVATIRKEEITEITVTVERVIEILENPKNHSIGDEKRPQTRIIETKVRKEADSEAVSEVASEAALEADSEVV